MSARTGAPSGREHFDAVVVGSGFGGSVTAARLAEAGRRVCVLERGRAYPPNSFPRSPLGMKQNFWAPSDGRHGLFDLWEFAHIDALCASGLGGGSLIYANVLLRKDERWFVNEDLAAGGYEDWPVTRAELDPHYDAVERRIGVERFPLEQSPYDRTPKVLAYRDAAQRLGLDWSLAPLAVTFANQGARAVPGQPIAEAPNLHGRPRLTCRLCGECDIGCNYGAKNTLDFTYLTDAWRAGAELRTLCEVHAFAPLEGGGYEVDYVIHDPGEEGRAADGRPPEARTITCEHLILSAGTLGTNWLLLRNRGALPGLSPALGRGFSGNGDLLTFAIRATQTGAGGGTEPRVIEPSRGPVITSAIRIPDTLDGGDGRGFYLEDAGYPEFGGWVLEMLEEPEAIARAAPRAAHYLWSLLRGRADTETGAIASALLGDCELSSGLLPLLGMGRDVPDGRMSLKDERLEVDFDKDGRSRAYFDRVRSVSRAIADELGAEFFDNPIWHEHRVITVHALGGSRMGRSPQQGVVDPHGRVFGHPGLHIADGSVMPGPVGANPSLTIAALADRFAEAILDEPRGASIAVPDTAGVPDVASPASAPATMSPAAGATALAFTEEMKGFVTFGEHDFAAGFHTGQRDGTAFMFHLTITAGDIERFIADPGHAAQAEGWVHSDALGGRLEVSRGDFNLFVDQPDPGARRMLYRLEFSDGEQHPLTMTGYKQVSHGSLLHLWPQTTTLYTRVLAGHVPAAEEAAAEILASGVIHILPLDFARQLTTFRVHPADRLDALGRFGALFAGELWDVYGPAARDRPGASSP